MENVGKIFDFNKMSDTGFRYYFESEIKANEIIYLKMPPISSNKRGINDIGWQSNTNIKIYATLCHFLKENEEDKALWTKINDNADINKTVTYLKVVGGNENGKVYINAILC